MRMLLSFVVGAALVSGLALASDQGGPNKCKAEGLHLCCKGCEKTVQDVLGKVAGVSDVACDRATKTVTFKARTDKATDQAVSALVDAGFHFTVTVGDKNYPVTSKASGLKADEIVVRNVHACCEDCEKAIEAVVKEAKVTFAGQGPLKDVAFAGKGLDADEILRKMQAAGFQGVIGEKKK